ncbi:MAG: response regulator [Candidatus Dormibacteria bacterium]
MDASRDSFGSAAAPARDAGPLPARLRVCLAEDHTIVRAGMRALLECDPGLEVVGEAASGPEALEQIMRLEPDVALVDIRLPGMNGLAVTAALHTAHPQVRVLIVSAFDDPDYVQEALRVGAVGYLLKTASPAELLRAIQSAVAGTVVLDASVSEQLVSRSPRLGPSAEAGLTDREHEVLESLARGLPNKQIAVRLNLGLRTVEGHVTKILTKLGVSSRTEAALWAAVHGFGDSDKRQRADEP